MKKGIIGIILITLLIGCQSKTTPVQHAVAVLTATEGSTAHGVVSFTAVDGGVKVDIDVAGLTGTHAIHVHQYGDISDLHGKAAGGHFNPEGHSHGAPSDHERHIGDLGNIQADDQGHAVVSFVDSQIALQGEDSIIGRGVIIHAMADDFTSQPTGAAGARVAQGVIGIAK